MTTIREQLIELGKQAGRTQRKDHLSRESAEWAEIHARINSLLDIYELELEPSNT